MWEGGKEHAAVSSACSHCLHRTPQPSRGWPKASAGCQEHPHGITFLMGQPQEGGTASCKLITDRALSPPHSTKLGKKGSCFQPWVSYCTHHQVGDCSTSPPPGKTQWSGHMPPTTLHFRILHPSSENTLQWMERTQAPRSLPCTHSPHSPPQATSSQVLGKAPPDAALHWGNLASSEKCVYSEARTWPPHHSLPPLPHLPHS